MKQERGKLPGEKLQTAVWPAIGAIGGAKAGGALAAKAGLGATGTTIAKEAGTHIGTVAGSKLQEKNENASVAPPGRLHIANIAEFQDGGKKYVKKEWLDNKKRFRYVYPEDMHKPISKIQQDFLKGGLADGKSDSEYNSDQLKKGRAHEMEHTNNKAIAKEIAKDHLEEDSKYYDKLEKIESQDVDGPRSAWKWKEHKYAARTGSKGNYKYVYKDQGKNIRDDLDEEDKEEKNLENRRFIPGETPEEQNRKASRQGTGYDSDANKGLGNRGFGNTFQKRAPEQKLPAAGSPKEQMGYMNIRGIEMQHDVIGVDNPELQGTNADPLQQVTDQFAYENARDQVIQEHQRTGGKIYANKNHYILLYPDGTIADPVIQVRGAPLQVYAKGMPYQFQRIK